MRTLWLNQFDYSGNVEAVINWAGGAAWKDLGIHLVLTGVPPDLCSLYERFLNKKGLKNSLNINRQQIQNLLYYRNFNSLHVFHPDLFGLAGELGNSFHIPWLASVSDGEMYANYRFLHTASYITCCNTVSYQAIKKFFYPYNKQNVFLIPQGVTIKPADFPALDNMRIVYIGPLEGSHIASFQELGHAVRNLESASLSVISRRNPAIANIKFYPWRPDFSDITKGYNVIAGFGYCLLQGIAAGKIALLLEEKYNGFFSPYCRKQVPDFRAKAQEEKDPAGPYHLNRDIQALHGHLPAAANLQQENWRYARENHDLEIVAEKIARLYSDL